ncbi:heterokaryon incompatibility [Cadophora sp. DSE1049]|nr:heterokaryon incompatibility [Cadophora sp. DSE1049]
MRLLRNFVGDNIPKYAILSHTWSADTEEVTFQDLMNYTAERDGLQYFWVDTCCIDKTNNTELAEAINSMFRWYRNATKCYVYLSDVSTTFHESRWFTRGWTF